MPRFTVIVTRTVETSAEVEITAADEDEACRQAKTLVEESPDSVDWEVESEEWDTPECLEGGSDATSPNH